MTRLVKTTTEMEGRFEEKWVLVDEDDQLEAWAADAALRVVGQPATRLTGPQRVSGTARYTTDVTLAGMLHAVVLRSPHAHATLRAIDADAARATPGVRAVLTPDTPLGFSLKRGPLHAEPVYAGAPVAVVCADTEPQARQALAALDARFEPLPFVVDTDTAFREQRFDGDPHEQSRGDVDAATATADITVELTLDTPTQLQTALEPHAAVCWWQPAGLTCWVSTQGIFDAQQELSRRFDLPKERVRVIAEYVGGGFGAKQGAGVEALLAAELSRVTGRPVRLVNDRHGEQLDAGSRPATRQTVRLAARSDGTLVAVDAETLTQFGMAGWRAVNTPAMSLYACDAARGVEANLSLHLRQGNAFRAPAIMEGVTALEQAIDELAIRLAIDPLDLRRRNHAAADQPSGKPYTLNGLLACYDTVARLSGWADRDQLRGPQPDGLLRGVGVAAGIWWGGGGPPAHATIRLGSNGVATVIVGVQDIGTGTLTTTQIVAAEELGFPLDRVVVSGGDTQPNIYAPVAGGSQITPSVTPAVRSAAAEVKRTLLKLAGDVFEASPDDLALADGRIRSRDGALDEPYTAVTSKLGNATIDGSGMRGPNPDEYRVNTFGCQVAQVAVDVGTGVVVCEAIWAVHDIGRVINPLGASSQVEGGVLQGVGYALTEQRRVDPTLGVPTNATLDDYKLPTIADTPRVTVAFVNEPDTLLSSVGAKGLGEPPVIPTAAAIANAFRHATGRRAAALPLTPQRVLETLA
jgi:CO/xanthine dehydrogenase Mo-binding subunit